MSDQSIYQIDQILLSFPTLDEVKIHEVISYDPSRKLLTELIEIFDVEIAEKIKFIKHEYKENQLNELSRWAHRIRSTSLNLGAVRLSEILKRIEYMALEPDLINTEIEFLMNALEKEFSSASIKLHSLLQTGDA
jgi:HPt (histidine-containing phosphotransfer) domain-containing protein